MTYISAINVPQVFFTEIKFTLKDEFCKYNNKIVWGWESDQFII